MWVELCNQQQDVSFFNVIKERIFSRVTKIARQQ